MQSVEEVNKNPCLFKRLSVGSQELRQALYNGRAQDSNRRFLMKEILCRSGRPISVVFELVDDSKIQKPKFGPRIFQTTRAFSLAATLSPALITLMYGIWMGEQTSWYRASLCLVGLFFLQIAVNILNDVEDYLKLIDGPKLLGGSGALVNGWYTAKQLKRAGLACLLIGLTAGLAALLHSPIALALLSLIGFLAAYGYSSSPIGLKYRGLGDFIVFLACGPALTVGFSYTCFGFINEGVIGLGFIFGFLSMAFLHINNMEDIELDSSRGATTLATLLGFSRARLLLVVDYFLVFVVLGVAGYMGWLPIPFVLTQLLLIPAIGQTISRIFKASGPLSPQMKLLRISGAKTLTLSGLLGLISFAVLLIL